MIQYDIIFLCMSIYVNIIYAIYAIQWLYTSCYHEAPAPGISVLLSQGRRGLRQALGLFKVVVLFSEPGAINQWKECLKKEEIRMGKKS